MFSRSGYVIFWRWWNWVFPTYMWICLRQRKKCWVRDRIWTYDLPSTRQDRNSILWAMKTHGNQGYVLRSKFTHALHTARISNVYSILNENMEKDCEFLRSVTECESCDNQHVTSMGQRKSRVLCRNQTRRNSWTRHRCYPRGEGELKKVNFREALPWGPTPIAFYIPLLTGKVAHSLHSRCQKGLGHWEEGKKGGDGETG